MPNNVELLPIAIILSFFRITKIFSNYPKSASKAGCESGSFPSACRSSCILSCSLRFAALSGSASELSETNYYHGMYAGILRQIQSYESAINNLKNTSSDQVDQVMEIHVKAVSSYYDKINLLLQDMENVAKYND